MATSGLPLNRVKAFLFALDGEGAALQGDVVQVRDALFGFAGMMMVTVVSTTSPMTLRRCELSREP